AGARQTREPRERLLGRGTDDQLPRHPPHVASRGRRRDPGAEGHALRQPETEAEGARHLDAVEVLLEVPQDVCVVVAGGKDVDEAEELGPEARMRHGPLEEPLAPPAEVVDARLLGAGGLGDPARERLDVALEGVEHPRPGYPPPRPRTSPLAGEGPGAAPGTTRRGPRVHFRCRRDLPR